MNIKDKQSNLDSACEIRERPTDFVELSFGNEFYNRIINLILLCHHIGPMQQILTHGNAL